ncbi:MAG: hypothetical protein QXP34_02995 [Candidatus Aenigmatarchaeota archaeon]
MKLQVHVIPEVSLDVLLIVISLSFTLGTFILYTEYNLEIVKEDSNISKKLRFLDVILGDKCILADKSKGIIDLNKVKSKKFCINEVFSMNFIVEGENIIFGKDCSKEKEVAKSYAVFYKDQKYVEGIVLVC